MKKKIGCRKDWDNARKVFPENKNLWPLTNSVVGKKLQVSFAFIQRLRVKHGIPFATRKGRLPPAEVLKNERALIASYEFGEFRGFSNQSQPWLSAKFNIPVARIGVLQSEYKVLANPTRIAIKANQTWAPDGYEDLMILMHTWICKLIVSQ